MYLFSSLPLPSRKEDWARGWAQLMSIWVTSTALSLAGQAECGEEQLSGEVTIPIWAGKVMLMAGRITAGSGKRRSREIHSGAKAVAQARGGGRLT